MNQPQNGFLPPNTQPLGTPTQVRRVTPTQPMAPGQNAGMVAQQMGGGMPPQQPGYRSPSQQPPATAYVQGQQPPAAMQGMGNRPDITRPEVLEQIIQQQNQQADPERMADQANQLRIENVLSEYNQRAAEQQAQMNQAVSLMSQSQQQQAEYQRQQLELQRAQLQAAEQQRAMQEQRPWEAANLQLDAETSQVFEESLPVIETVSRRNALQTAHETVQAQVAPEIQRLQEQINALNSQAQSTAESNAASFAERLRQTAAEHGLNVDVIDDDPDWIAYKREISNPLTGETIDNAIVNALQGRQERDIVTLRNAFKTFSEKRNQQQSAGGDQQLPPQIGNSARTPVVEPTAANAQNADYMNSMNQHHQELEQYRAQLFDQLKRGQIPIQEFQAEVAKVEQSVDALISQTQAA